MRARASLTHLEGLMGILDKLLGKKSKQQQVNATRDTSVAKGLDLQSDEIRAEGRRKMEAEMEASRTERDTPKP
jgi:hypothetical protein